MISSEAAQVLRVIVGKRLLGVLALIYVYEEEEHFPPQALMLLYEGDRRLKLTCGSDGASLEWSDGELVETDLGEYGEEVVRDFGRLPQWQGKIGRKLAGSKYIYSEREKRVIGLELLFIDEPSVKIMNLGDELYVFEDIPHAVFQEQELEFHSI